MGSIPGLDLPHAVGMAKKKKKRKKKLIQNMYIKNNEVFPLWRSEISGVSAAQF